MHQCHLTRAALVGGAASTLLLLGAAGASAHIDVSPTTTEAGAYSVLSFAVGHGCDGSATTSVAIDIPEEVVTVTPTAHPGWEISTVTNDDHVDQVVFTADQPLEDGIRDTFELALPLPETAGEEVVFPILQTCEEGETAWTETSSEGEDEPAHPAPYLTLTEADASAGDEGDTSSSAAQAAGWGGLALGALGLAAGVTALLRTRRSA
ncbi:YcnI family protein [Aeromicrobium piscarium]|nr:YcnI family protein [Aeromicrobium piscarium]